MIPPKFQTSLAMWRREVLINADGRISRIWFQDQSLPIYVCNSYMLQQYMNEYICIQYTYVINCNYISINYGHISYINIICKYSIHISHHIPTHISPWPNKTAPVLAGARWVAGSPHPRPSNDPWRTVAAQAVRSDCCSSCHGPRMGVEP